MSSFLLEFENESRIFWVEESLKTISLDSFFRVLLKEFERLIVFFLKTWSFICNNEVFYSFNKNFFEKRDFSSPKMMRFPLPLLFSKGFSLNLACFSLYLFFDVINYWIFYDSPYETWRWMLYSNAFLIIIFHIKHSIEGA